MAILNNQNQVSFEFHILGKFHQLKKKAVVYFTNLGSSAAEMKAVKNLIPVLGSSLCFSKERTGRYVAL